MTLRFVSPDSWDGMRAIQLAADAAHQAHLAGQDGRPARASEAAGAGRRAGPAGVLGGEVLVTPHKPITRDRATGTVAKPATLFDRLADPEEVPFFCDWLTIKQTSPEPLPVVAGGLVQTYDEHGQLQFSMVKGLQHEGSHDTSIQIRSDGHTWSVSGNLSRYGRPDNLFGFDLAGCVRRASDIAQSVGLPAFTAGQAYPVAVRTEGGGHIERTAWTGARISRIDLTCNYATGSADAAHHYMRWLSSQQHSRRIKVGTVGQADGETVDWGRGSRRIYAKAYVKHKELLRHGAPSAVSEYCETSGVVRFELTLKATQLQSMGCHYLGSLHMGQLIALFNEKRAVMARAEYGTDGLDALPKHFRATARDYIAGMDVMAGMSEASARRHRKALLPFGIDIAVASNVHQFTPQVRVIELKPLSMPDWYQLPQAA